MQTLLGDVAMTLRLARRLPRYLRKPLTRAESLAILKRRLERRGEDFLALIGRAVFANPESPYRTLLGWAGCEYGDLERLVQEQGVEDALRDLFRAGIYLTVDEFKGRRPVIRGTNEMAVDPARLRNPLPSPHIRSASSGSRGSATSVKLDLASVRDRAVNMSLALEARGGADWRNAVWSLRGAAPILWYSGRGTPPARWFVRSEPAWHGLASRFHWSARIIVWSSRLAGVPIPAPEFVPFDAPLPVVRWLAEALRAGAVPHLWGSTSSAVQVCRAAEAAGADVAGARFTVTGEPVTEARLEAIRRVGGDAVADYGSSESGGSASYGCLSPEAPDEVHFFDDLNALIQVGESPFPADALLLTSLRPTTPFVLLNVSMGDRATSTERRCGCPLEALGWRTHLQAIRSYEKLNAGGVMLEDGDVVRVLEQTLPRLFGGGPTDYQLVEDEADDGAPRLRLRVHPAVGALDPTAVANAFLAAIGGDSDSRRDMANQWRRAGFLRVEREAPLVTGLGKIHHLVAAPEPGPRRSPSGPR
jgi:hypothetical protein